MDWEACKENARPVRTGRTKAALSDVHDAADSATKQANLAKRRCVVTAAASDSLCGTSDAVQAMRRRELERDIREYNGDDPLEPWLRSVPWYTEMEQLRGCMHDHGIDMVATTRAFSSRLVTSLHRLVKWTQEHLGGGSKAQLQETIEKCTHALAPLGSKYYPDVRYLRLWIQYVSRSVALGDTWLAS